VTRGKDFQFQFECIVGSNLSETLRLVSSFHSFSLFYFIKRNLITMFLHVNHPLNDIGASVAEWLRSLTSNHLPITAVGSNPERGFGFFHVRKLSS
jgi:hypothetical protein